MTVVDVLVVGSGALATSVCDGLAAVAPARPSGPPVTVTVAARDPDAARRLALTASIRAAETRVARTGQGDGGPGVRFDSRPLDDVRSGVLRPAVLVVCASHQSPYEGRHQPSAWTSLLRTGGFGIGLALQAALVHDLARAMARHSPETAVVNGCFPDAVNPLLSALDTPVTCGIGNVATIAAALRATLAGAAGSASEGATEPLRVLAHHVHLAVPGPGAPDARAWLGTRPVADVTARLAAARALPRARLNDIAGLAGAGAVLALLGDRPVAAHAPGPLGLPGGYPVTLAARAAALDLPPGVSADEAVAWNRRAALADGVSVDGGRVTHTDRVAAALAPHLPGLAAGWPVDALADVARRLLALRETLRTRPAAGSPAGPPAEPPPTTTPTPDGSPSAAHPAPATAIPFTALPHR